MVALHIRIPLLNYKRQEPARKPATLTGTWVQGTSEQNIIAKLNKEKHVIGSHIFSHFVGFQILKKIQYIIWHFSRFYGATHIGLSLFDGATHPGLRFCSPLRYRNSHWQFLLPSP